MKKTGFYFPELDSLRFLAFMMVLVHHAPFVKSIEIWRTLAKYGWMGVDLFLCLSAFLFTKLLYVEFQETGSIRVKNFYIRRAFRIWPLYFFFFLLSVALTLPQPAWDSYVYLRALGMLTFTDNILTARNGYNAALPFTNHLWTISYEEQVYLVIPWALYLFYKIRQSAASLLISSLFLTGTLIRAGMIYNNVQHPDIWVLPISHFESVLGGIVIGLGMLDKILKKLPAWFWFGFGILALVLVTRLPNVGEIGFHLMLTYPLIGAGMSLIIYAVMQKDLWLLTPLLRNKFTRYLGKISYGLYVYHLLGIDIAYKITDRIIEPTRFLAYPATALLLSFLVTALMAAISYQMLEKPFLQMKERFAIITSRPA